MILLHFLLNIVTVCIITWSVIARVSEPVADCSFIDIGPIVHPYRPARVVLAIEPMNFVLSTSFLVLVQPHLVKKKYKNANCVLKE